MSTAKYIKKALVHFIGLAVALFLMKWSSSWRKDDEQIARLDQLLDDGERVIVVFWHGKYFPLFALAKGRRAVAVISGGFRGEIIAKVCRWFGYEVALIPSHGRRNRFHQIKQALEPFKLVAIAIDGPTGPYHQIKPGAIRLASELGYLIVPVSVACSPKRVMTKRWDKRELPCWSAKVSLVVGDPIRIPAGLQKSDVEMWSAKLKSTLENFDMQAEARVRQ